MRKKKTRKTTVKTPVSRHPALSPRPMLSDRARMERTLGRKLLRGEIPVVPPSQLPRCPIVPTYVKDYEQLCRDYADGKLTDADVQAKVSEALKTLKQPKPEQPKEGNKD